MKKYFIFLVIALIIFLKQGISQISFPSFEPVFDDSFIPKINILIAQDSLNDLLAPGNENSEHEYPAIFVFYTSNDTDTVTNIGFKLRGNTSVEAAKKSFKVSFNTFVDGQKYHGLEKMNLNGEHNDPSVVRSKLCWDILYDFECAGARSNHVELYFNGDYRGLYINVEHIDEEFAESRFGNKNGNLYKCLYPADLAYINSNPESYKFEIYGRRAYELKTNTDEDNYSDIANFIDILNNKPITDLPQYLEPVFDVNLYLKVLAVDIFTGNWDDYSYNKNNFYLYHNTQTGKIEYIPYDLDNTYGIDWFGIDWATRNIYSWENSSEQRPLTKRLLQVQKYRDRFSFYFNELVNNVVNENILFPKIDIIHSMIENSLTYDPFYSLDYGFTINDFNDSYTEALGQHVIYGLEPYISARINSINSQLEINDIAPIIWQVSHNNPDMYEEIAVRAMIEDENNNINAKLFFQINQSSFDSVVLYNDGNHFDINANDKFFGGIISALNEAGVVNYYIKATDISGQTTREPIVGNYQLIINSTTDIQLYINEFLASNNSNISDENGEFEDWIEIYNNSNETIWLGDKFLTDNILNPGKWSMPDLDILPGEFLIFWADEDTAGCVNHTNFKLSKDGEEIGLYTFDGNNFVQIDYISFGEQTDDVSFGRYPNGSGVFMEMPPTPGYSNVTFKINTVDNELFKIFPNPFNQELNICFNEYINYAKIQIFDFTGKFLYSDNVTNSNIWSLKNSNFDNGVYFINISLNYGEKGYYFKLIKD